MTAGVGLKTTEVWFRNPNAYVKELAELGVHKVIWDRGVLVKKALDPIKHAELYFGTTTDWRILCCGPQGTTEYRPGDQTNRPTACYPTWEWGEEPAILLDMIENPAGEDRNACADTSVEGSLRPVWGQEHRVVITNLPAVNSGPVRAFLRWLKEVQEDNQNCIVHLHGSYSFKVNFGLGWGAADVDPRFDAQKGKVILGSGKPVPYEKTMGNPQWVTQHGFTPGELSVPRNRCMFNIKSAIWAGANYAMLNSFVARKTLTVDSKSSDADFVPPQTKSPFIGRPSFVEGDKQLCDTCSISSKCRFSRVGAVCTLPDAEPKSLADMFQSRDADTIIDGLGTLMAAGASRLEQGRQEEIALMELNPEVTKMLNNLFKQGESLAKLIDPKLRGGVKVNVNTQGGAAGVQISGGNQKVAIAAIFRDFELNGISREDVTPAMVESVFAAIGRGETQQAAIEGTVVSSRTER